MFIVYFDVDPMRIEYICNLELHQTKGEVSHEAGLKQYLSS